MTKSNNVIRPLLVLFVGVLVWAGTAQGAELDGIVWYKDMKKASEAAVNENKIIMVDFWADWCAACKVMDEEVYPNLQVIDAVNQNIIAVRVNFDMQQELARKYGIPALPFLLFTNSYGTKLLYHRGLLETATFLNIVNGLPKDISQLNRLDRGLQEDKNHVEGLLAMAAEMRKSSFYESSNDYYARALKQNDLKKDAAKREAAMFEMGKNALQLMDGKAAAETFEKCLKEFPKSASRATYLLGAGQGFALDENNDKAKKSLNSVLTEFPQSESATKAQELLKNL